MAPTSYYNASPPATAWSTSTSSPTLAIRQSRLRQCSPRPHLRPRRHLRLRTRPSPFSKPISRMPSSTSPLKATSTAPSSAPKSSSPPTSSAPFACSTPPSPTIARSAAEAQANFRFLHVSTDEVYGSLELRPRLLRDHAYAPNSPYAASKAASRSPRPRLAPHLRTADLTTNCSNNYGPYQFPEKLIPLVIIHALAGKPLPIYGDGLQVRDWLYVVDHCKAIALVLEKGTSGNLQRGRQQRNANIEVVNTICSIIDEVSPLSLLPTAASSPSSTIVPATTAATPSMPPASSARSAGQRETFSTGIRRTIEWYLSNAAWIRQVTSGDYRKWITTNYESRGAKSKEAQP